VSVDDRLQELLERLGRTLGDALANADTASEVVEAARREGVSLYLRLEPHRNEDGSRGLRLVPAEDPEAPSADENESAIEAGSDVRPGLGRRSAARLRRAQLRLPRAQPPGVRPASYRLDQADVEFLRKLGIDPSRTGRSKSSRGKS